MRASWFFSGRAGDAIPLSRTAAVRWLHRQHDHSKPRQRVGPSQSRLLCRPPTHFPLLTNAPDSSSLPFDLHPHPNLPPRSPNSLRRGTRPPCGLARGLVRARVMAPVRDGDCYLLNAAHRARAHTRAHIRKHTDASDKEVGGDKVKVRDRDKKERYWSGALSRGRERRSEGGREGGMQGGREGERDAGREGGREGGREARDWRSERVNKRVSEGGRRGMIKTIRAPSLL